MSSQRGESPKSTTYGEDVMYDPPSHLTLFCVEFKRNTVYFLIEGLCFVGFIFNIVRASTIDWLEYSWRFYAFFAAMFLFCMIFAELNRQNRFREVASLCYQWRYPIVSLFLLLALIDLIFLRLSDVPNDCTCTWYYDWDEDCAGVTDDDSGCPPLNPEEDGIRYVTRTLTILCGILFVGCILGYWEQASHTVAHNDWIVAFLCMTVIGFVLLYFSRALKPPDNQKTHKDAWAWHQNHDQNKVLSRIVVIMIVFVMFFVVMGSIVLALFGDAALASGNLGTFWAILVFSLISFVIMITPLAPGSVVDVAAGFLMVTLFVQFEDMDVPESFLVSLAITIVLHFIGSCLQYYVGKIRAVQIWGNKELPPSLLAASDSVLKTANWVKVGIVGQVFMDTANGLNQGRMNMEFCTQFWSEYASIPNAISLVALGTVLAIQGFSEKLREKYEWADEAIPLIIMIAWLWQMMGSSWGFKELLQSIHTESYWTALEKWATVQHFSNLGYVPNQNGWERDVYELGVGRNGRIPLFTKVQELHPPEAHRAVTKESALHYCGKLLEKPKDSGKQRKKMIESIRLDRKRSEIREKHWNDIRNLLDGYVAEGLVSKIDKKEEKPGIFENSEGNKLYVHYLIVLGIYLTGGGSYVWIASEIGLDEAVSEGVEVLKGVSTVGWLSFTFFWILVLIYFWHSFVGSLRSCGSGIAFIASGMKVDPNWETVFNTPQWQKDDNGDGNAKSSSPPSGPATDSKDVLIATNS